MNFAKLFALSCLSGVTSAFSPAPPASVVKSPVAKSPLTQDHLHIAKLCRDVYTEEVEVSSGFVESKDTGVQATVSLDGSRAIVCFRGSSEIRDHDKRL
jgi:lysyl-tRNA synthetase class II